MKKTNFTFSFLGDVQHSIFSNVLRPSAVILFCLLLFHAKADAQSCVLACHDAQISLDMDCNAEVTHHMISDTSACLAGDYEVHVMTLAGDTLPLSPMVGYNEIGMTLMASVFDVVSGNSCWSTITVEDKMAPLMDCDCAPVTSIEGVLDVMDLTVDIEDPCWAFPPLDLPPVGGGGHYYDTYPFSITVAGMYTFTFAGVPTDAIGAIFDGPFDPNDVCANLIGGDDDSGSGFDPELMIQLNLVPGDYTLVTSTWSSFGNLGAYSWAVSGPGDIVQDIEQCIVSCTDVSPIFPGPAIDDNCSGGTTILVDEDLEPICHPLFIQKLTRWYTAVDAAGNYADTCKQVFFLERIDFEAITWPPVWSIANNNAISCSTPFPDVDNDGNPDPTGFGGTGVPRLNGNPIYPDFNFNCNSATTFEDVNIGPIGCVRKIMRMWTVREWHCEGERDTMFVQLIEIVDDEGPVLDCPFDVELTTNTSSCTATYLVPPVVANDDCNGISLYNVTYPGGFKSQNGGFYADLPVGDNLITYTVYDDCLNSTECSFTVTVMDDTPPVPVCDEHTIVGLTGFEFGGLTTVPAEVFDDGSYDDCGPVTFEVRRMNSCIDFDWTTNGAGVDNNPNGFFGSVDQGTVLRPRVPFACCDVAADEPIMVVLVVTDQSGNSNTCMVEVNVQDKIKPIITCPTDVTVSCELDYDLDGLSIFGSIQLAEADVSEWCVYDPSNDYSNQDGFVCGIDGLALDNCSVEIIPGVIPNINNCGIGTITRTFIARDPNGSSSCNQVITVKNFDPLETRDIVWPWDYSDVECNIGTDPDDLPAPYNYPTVTEDECDLVGMNYEDLVFPFVEGACFKILRTWQIIEWCRFEELGGLVLNENYWVHEQIIKVTNQFGPTFETLQPTITECNEFDCGGLFIELVQTADDDCTPLDELVWSWALDANNDNTINDTRSGTGNRIDASGNYPLGSHRIIYSFEDKCGNKTTKEQFFTIESCKKPTPICINGLSADLMGIDTNNDGEPDAGMVTIWASDFDKGSLHPCGLPVTVSFSEDPSDISRVFDCSHVTGGQTSVRMYVHDSQGRFDYCETYIIIQDNFNVCGGNTGGGTAVIAGEVVTESTLEVADVAVSLMGTNMLPVVTTSNGVYAFPSMPLGGTYEVAPARDGDDKNGVSTLDLVRIQRHLLGIEAFTSPYDMIAADANNSGSVSAIDLIELRKLILGIYDDLPSNTSWRFIDEGYVFPDPYNPWLENFRETYTMNALNQDMPNVDFVGIKIGDVNNTVVANATQVVIRKAPEALELVVEQTEVQAGDIVTIPVHAENFDAIQGFQFTMDFAADQLELQNVGGGVLEVSEDNFGLNRLEEGTLTMSWFDMQGRTESIENTLFELTFVAKANGSLDQMISINSDITPAEAYPQSNEILDVSLTFRGGKTVAAEFELLQNRPNPFSEVTTIAFMLPADAPATLTVFDITGKVLRSIEVEGVKGYNEVTLQQSQLAANGILYYQLATEGYMATRKMVVTK
jgi:hypothetical protein